MADTEVPEARNPQVGDASARRCLFRLAVPAIGLFALTSFVVLFLYAPDTYYRILRAVLQVPRPRPFVDWEYIYAAVRCAKQ